MNPSPSVAPRRVALIGNPNTGKSTLFSRLSGLHQRTGNYPGVTVEKKHGVSRFEGVEFEWIDLPGTYSLVPRSPDEWIAVNVLVGNQPGEVVPDAVLCVLDATNLERNLFLLSQLLDLDLPVVVALNKTDLAQGQKLEIDVEQLSEELGVPVVATQAHRREGVEALQRALLTLKSRAAREQVAFPEALETHERQLVEGLQPWVPEGLSRFLVHRLLLSDDRETERRILGQTRAERPEVQALLKEHRQGLIDEGINRTSVEAVARYSWISEVTRRVLRRPSGPMIVSWADRWDRLLVHKVWGTAIFLVVMALVFQAIFSWAEPLMGVIESATGWLGEQAAARLPDGVFESLIVDGVIAGVGGVIVFLPQILILFFFIGLLEDCGYLARAAFLMDRLMARIGLNGKSFIPLLSSFACAIPGVMSTRTIENPRDRLITILVAPLMSCSARLPVYTVLIAAFIPPVTWLGGWVSLRGLTMFAMYSIGVVAAVLVAFTLRKTLLRGASAPFLLELPPFKFPSFTTVLARMFERGWAFVRRAGTLILAVSILVWAAASFPVDRQAEQAYETQRSALVAEQEQAAATTDEAPDSSDSVDPVGQLDNARAADRLRESALGQAGVWIEPVVRPLGWDWKIGCAVIASFPAREVVIGTMGVIYQLGGEQDETSQPLREALREATWDGTDRPVYNIPVALSIMVFFALCAQCASTLVIIRRETASWRWPVFTFVYMTLLAYVAAFATYQIGMLL